MKIIKIEHEGERITVWTDADTATGFGFDIDDIVDKADMLSKVKTRVQEHLAKRQAQQDREIKAQSLKTLEETKI